MNVDQSRFRANVHVLRGNPSKLLDTVRPEVSIPEAPDVLCPDGHMNGLVWDLVLQSLVLTRPSGADLNRQEAGHYTLFFRSYFQLSAYDRIPVR